MDSRFRGNDGEGGGNDGEGGGNNGTSAPRLAPSRQWPSLGPPFPRFLGSRLRKRGPPFSQARAAIPPFRGGRLFGLRSSFPRKRESMFTAKRRASMAHASTPSAPYFKPGHYQKKASVAPEHYGATAIFSRSAAVSALSTARESSSILPVTITPYTSRAVSSET